MFRSANPRPTLSGGEAQRVKLAAELARPDTGKTLYILDEPTTGLHFDDVRKLLDVIHRLADLGNTIVVIEHNLEVIKTADWVIDLGPEAGAGGGELVAEGTPEQIVKNRRSHTGRFLKPVLLAGPRAARSFALEDKSGRGKAERHRAKTGRQASAIGDSKTGAHASVLTPKSNSPERNGKGRTSGADDPWGSPRQSKRAEPGQGSAAEVKAPWEIDGRSWHTRDRVASNGRPTRWDGRILDRIVDLIESLAASDAGTDGESGFAPTDWSQRNVVRITGLDQSRINFPFFHATTSSEWIVTLRFFVPKRTFRLHELEEQLELVPFHESAPPVLCDQPRVKLSYLGPFQEITIVGHTLEEFDTLDFDEFLRKAVRAFLELGSGSGVTTASELA